MEVKLTSAIYFGITLGFQLWFLWDLAQAQEKSEAWLFSGKQEGQVGRLGTIIILLWTIFSLIWGGFFWW